MILKKHIDLSSKKFYTVTNKKRGILPKHITDTSQIPSDVIDTDSKPIEYSYLDISLKQPRSQVVLEETFKLLDYQFKLRDLPKHDPHLENLVNLRINSVFGRQWSIEGGAARIRKMVRNIFDESPQDFFYKIRQAHEIKLLDKNCFTELIWIWNKDKIRWEVRLFPLEKHFEYVFDPTTNLPIGVKVFNEYTGYSYNYTTGIDLISNQTMVQKAVPLDKYFISTYQGSFENPYGRYALLSVALVSIFKTQMIKKWAMRLDKFANPKIILKRQMVDVGNGVMLPALQNLPKKAIDKLKDTIQNIEKYGLIELPPGLEMTYMNLAQLGQSEYESYIKFLDEQMTKAWLGNPSLVEMLRGGSYAAMAIQQQISQPLIFQDLLTLEEEVNNQIIKRLVYYNFPAAKIEDYPRFKIARDTPELSIESKNLILETLKQIQSDGKIGLSIDSKKQIYKQLLGIELELEDKAGQSFSNEDVVDMVSKVNIENSEIDQPLNSAKEGGDNAI